MMRVSIGCERHRALHHATSRESTTVLMRFPLGLLYLRAPLRPDTCPSFIAKSPAEFRCRPAIETIQVCRLLCLSYAFAQIGCAHSLPGKIIRILCGTHGGLGKDFGSMNMDEFLKNIWTAEESYAMVAALGDGSGGFGTGAGLQRQASLTLPRTLSQKTVDQVWRGLVEPSSSGQGAAASCGGTDFPRQPTLGEMTLEEFLARAGVVREDMAPSQRSPTPIGNKSNNTNFYYGDLPAVNSSAGLELKFNQAPGRSNGNMANVPIAHGSAANLGMTATVARPYAPPVPLRDSMDLVNPQGMRGGELGGFGQVGMNNRLMTGMVGLSTAGVMGASGSPKNHLSSDEIGKGNGDLSSLSPVPYMFNGGMRERKRNRSLDKVVERRHRRMIKNRESAARSRARKQVICSTIAL
ncbi:hypothetical protein BHM03_00015029 [Ensete ventricosum]|nr:hypothetical protein BHM03_00015029 [Ensete ventricosum]